MSAKVKLRDPLLGPLTDDQLTRDVWLYQRQKGHRFSSDDLATALVALQAAPHARRVLDLGCGIGSVLLHLAWSLPHATLCGIEAQASSFELLRRNIERNQLCARVNVVHGDLRDAAALAPLGAGFVLSVDYGKRFGPDAPNPVRADRRHHAPPGPGCEVDPAGQSASVQRRPGRGRP